MVTIGLATESSAWACYVGYCACTLQSIICNQVCRSYTPAMWISSQSYLHCDLVPVKCSYGSLQSKQHWQVALLPLLHATLRGGCPDDQKAIVLASINFVFTKILSIFFQSRKENWVKGTAACTILQRDKALTPSLSSLPVSILCFWYIQVHSFVCKD